MIDFSIPHLTSPWKGEVNTIMAVQGFTASDIFGYPDYLKLKSSMTLFASVSDPDSVFVRILDKYYNGEQDARTLELLELQKKDE